MTPQEKYYSLLFPKLADPYAKFPWETEGFPRFVRDVVQEQADGDNGDDAGYKREDWCIVPDAFFVDEKERNVFVLEIIETNDIDEEKATRLSNCFWLLDYAVYQLFVVLYYPKTNTTFEIESLSALDFLADELSGRKYPHRDAFKTMKCRVEKAQAGAA